MQTRITASLGLTAIALLAFTLLNNQLFSAIRLDLTEDSLYTLSDGSIEIIHKIEAPIQLYFFFSDTSSRHLTSLRAYAKQVQALLQEYAAASDGKIILKIVDPVPFSEQEDMAAEFGLQSVPINNAGSELYFGLAGTNAASKQQTISFFQPDKQAFLEYDISELLQNLITTDKPVMGLMSSLKIQGDIDMQTFQTTPAWVVVDQLGQQFDIETVDASITRVPENIDLLMVVHPKDLPDAAQYALDQFAMAGGRLLIFVDPVAETDRPAHLNPMMQAQQPSQPSELNKLTSAWGVSLREAFVLGDAQSAMTVSGGPGGQGVRHITILGFTGENFSSTDVTISSLESINVSSAGILDINNNVATTITPLMRSSIYAKPIASIRLQMLSDPTDLQRDFEPTGDQYVVAARLSGTAISAFDKNPGADDMADAVAHIQNTHSLNAIVIADTDILSDRLWVQVQNFFGQTIANPWANNGDFIINAVDNLVGSNELISIRSRGQLTRPFDRVQALRREAEARYLQSADDLQAKLAETESKLTDLQAGKTEQGAVGLSEQQAATLLKFQQEKLRIRKQLRDVRHQLDKDIENLGGTLKFLNIALIPILLTALILGFNLVRVRRKLS